MSARISLSYDALDRIVAVTSCNALTVQSFYSRDHLSTELQGLRSRSIFRNADYLHVQFRTEPSQRLITFLATDLQRSILTEVEDAPHRQLAYTPYGCQDPETVRSSFLAFNGERPNTVTGHYLLGNGRRAYNPVLMRFNSPDKLSPFGRGGINAFAFCKGDPVNFNDPTGQYYQFILSTLKAYQRVMKIGWKSYSKILRPMGGGLDGVATLVSRAGYATTGAGWGMHAAGYPVGESVLIAGSGLMTAGKVLKGTHKLISAFRSGKLADSVRYRIRQLRSRGKPLVLDPEKVNIRSDKSV